MPSSHALHHHHSKKQGQGPKKKKNWIDYFIYFVVFAYPASMLPQILKIYTEKNAESIAISSWIIMIFFSLAWFTYGVVHKVKPLLISNTLWVAAYSAIIIAAIKY